MSAWFLQVSFVYSRYVEDAALVAGTQDLAIPAVERVRLKFQLNQLQRQLF